MTNLTLAIDFPLLLRTKNPKCWPSSSFCLYRCGLPDLHPDPPWHCEHQAGYYRPGQWGCDVGPTRGGHGERPAQCPGPSSFSEVTLCLHRAWERSAWHPGGNRGGPQPCQWVVDGWVWEMLIGLLLCGLDQCKPDGNGTFLSTGRLGAVQPCCLQRSNPFRCEMSLVAQSLVGGSNPWLVCFVR